MGKIKKFRKSIGIVVILFFGLFFVFGVDAAVTFQNSSEVKVAAGTEITINAPAGFSAGDLFIVYITKDDDVLINEDSDWTTLVNEKSGTGNALYVAWRIAEVGDTNWTWTGDSEGYYGVILRYTGQKDFAENTFYLDGSDVPASDPDTVWTDVTNTDDGNIGTVGSTTNNGDLSTNYVDIEGTNAPASGDTILSVRARTHDGTDFGAYVDLSTPAGGWTWAKLQALESRSFRFLFDGIISTFIFIDGSDKTNSANSLTPLSQPGGTVINNLSKIEISVLTSTPIYDSDSAVDSSNAPTAPSVDYTDLPVNSLAFQAFGADDNDIPYNVPATLTSRFNDATTTTGGAGGDRPEGGTGSTGTGNFTMNAIEQWAAVTVVIEAATIPPADTCNPTSPLSANYVFDCSDNCTQPDNLDAGGFNITFSNDFGHFNLNANIINFDRIFKWDACQINIFSGGFRT